MQLSDLFLSSADTWATAAGEGYRPYKGEVTTKHIEKHVEGSVSLGAYLIRAQDDKVRMLVLDIDHDDEALIKAISSALVTEVPDVSILVEQTGSRGWHIWVFFDDWVEARNVRAFARSVLSGLDLSYPVEIYPKQDSKHGGWGNLVRLPLGLHPKTDGRSKVFNAFLLPIDTQGELDPDLPIEPAPAWSVQEKAAKQIEFEGQSGGFIKATPTPSQLPCISAYQKGVPSGFRDEAMFRLAAYLHRQQVPIEAAYITLQKANANNKPPLSDSEINTKLQSAYSGAGYGLPCSSDLVGLDSPFCSPTCPVYATAKGEKPVGAAGFGANVEYPRIVRRDGVFLWQRMLKRGLEENKLSNFDMEVVSRLEMPGSGADVLRVRMSVGDREDIVDMPVSSFSTRNKLIEHLSRAEYAWYGNDLQCQYLKAFLTRDDLRTQKALVKIGRNETDDGDLWVFPNEVLGPDGPLMDEEYTYHRPSHLGIVNVSLPEKAVSADRMGKVLAGFMDLNAMNVMAPVIGWTLAVPFKSFFMRKIGHFPLLMLYGTRGAGKTQLVQRAVLPLFGYSSQEPQVHFCDTTRFVLVSYGAATNTVPLFLDEYRPNALSGTKLRQLWDQWRHLYAEDTDHRGRADLTRLEFKQTSPIVVAGEEMVSDPAMQERMIQVPLSPDSLTTARRKAFSALPPVELMAREFTLAALSTDPAPLLDAAKEAIAGTWERKAPPRIYDNLLVASFGLQFWSHLTGKQVTKDMVAGLMDISTMVIDEEGNVRTAVWADEFLLDIIGMINERGPFRWGKIEDMDTDPKLYFNLRMAHSEWSKELRSRGQQAVGLEPIRRQLDEAGAADFVLEKDLRKKMVGGLSLRVYEIDLTVAMERIDK